MARASKASAVPEPQAAQDAVRALVDSILAAFKAANDRLPEGLRADPFVVENVLNQEFDKRVNFTAWKAVAVAEFIALMKSGKGPAPHDPTELA